MPVAYGRSESPTTSAVVEGGTLKNLWHVMNVPKMQQAYVPSVYRLLTAAAEQLAPHVTHDEIIMLRASSGALRLYAISTRPASTAAGAIFKDSLSFSTELSLHRQRRARGSTTTGRGVRHG